MAAPVPAERVPGDINEDDAVNLADAVILLRYLYLGDDAYRYEIEQAGRGYMNPGDDRIDLNDVIYLIQFLYNGGNPPITTNQVPGGTGRIHREIRDGFTFELNEEGSIEIAWPEASEFLSVFESDFSGSWRYRVRLDSPHTGVELDLPNGEMTGQTRFRVTAPPRPEFAGTYRVSFIAESPGRLPIVVPGPLLDLPEIPLDEYPVRYSPLLKGNVQDITGTVNLLQQEVHPGGLFQIEGPFDPKQEVSYLLVPAPYIDSPGIAPPDSDLISMGGTMVSGPLEEMPRNENPAEGKGAAVRRITIGRVVIFQAPSIVIAGPLFRVFVFAPRNQLPPLFADAGVIRLEDLRQRCSQIRNSRGTVVRRGLRYTDFSNDVSLPDPGTVTMGETFQISSFSRDLNFDLPQGYLRVILQDLNAPGPFGETGIRLTRVNVEENGRVLRILIPPMTQLAGREFGVAIFGDNLFCQPWYASAGVVRISPLSAGNVAGGRDGITIGNTRYRDHSRTTGLGSTVAGLAPGEQWVNIQDTRHSFNPATESIQVKLTDPDRPSIQYSGRFLVTPGDGTLWFSLPFLPSLRGRTVLVEVFVHPYGEGEPVYARAGYLRIR